MRTAARILASAAILAIAGAAPAAGAEGRVALLPVTNLTGRTLDAAPIEAALRSACAARGAALLPPADLRAFMDRHRVRWTGGIDRELGAALRDEEGVDAVVVVAVERWAATDPPEIGWSARLVSTDHDLRILAVADAGSNGEDHPGFLRLSVVHDPAVLLARAAAATAESLFGDGARDGRAERRFRPRMVFSAIADGTSRPIPRIAVLPFTNRTGRRNAGELVALHLVNRLADRGDVEVVEPGLVRTVLLKLRLIPAGGISYAQSDVLRETLGADYLVNGDVLDYADGVGEGAPPTVDFTVQLLDTAARRVVWSSFSHNTGTDRVWFFDRGHLRSAAALGSAMAEAAADLMFPRKGRP